MKTFQWAFLVLLRNEGGFVDNAKDPGGATKFGVSLRFLRKEGIDINDDGDIDEFDILAITEANAKAIYKQKFWVPCKCPEIKSELLAIKIFDMAVNMGQRQAYKLVQRAVNTLEYDPSLVEDGVVGAKTISALNYFYDMDYKLIAAIREEQADFYLNLIEKRPQLSEFRLGWLRRSAV